MNKFVHTKSHTDSKSSNTSLGYYAHEGLCTFFSAASDGATANRHILDCIFGQFLTSLRKDSVANYASVWTLFSPTVRGLDAFYNAVSVSYFRLVPQDSQICGGNCPKRKKNQQLSRVVPNTLHGYY